MYKLSIIVLMDKTNKEKSKVLKSLEGQTLKEIEVLCITNESKDIEGYENLQRINTFEEALEKVNGEYTAIVNLNSFFEATWAEKAYDYAKIENDDLVICDLEIEDYEENRLKSYVFDGIENDINRMVILNWNLCNLVFKTEKIKKIKLKQHNRYNELMFILEALAKCKKIGYAQDIKSYMYMKKSDINNVEIKDVEELKDALKGIKDLYKSMGKNNDNDKYFLSAISFILLGVHTSIDLYNRQNELKIDIKEKIRDIINYLDINFFEWRNNPILNSNFIKKEYPYIWFASKMYKYGYAGLYLKFYRFIYNK